MLTLIIPDNFTCPHDKLSWIVWKPIGRYVLLHLELCLLYAGNRAQRSHLWPCLLIVVKFYSWYHVSPLFLYCEIEQIVVRSTYKLLWVIAWFVVIFGINSKSDISKLLYEISQAVRRVKFETILKYHKWYLCQILRTNHAIICLYYYLKRFVIFTCWYFK